MNLPVVPESLPRMHNKFLPAVGEFILNKLGWQVVGELPKQKKFIFAVAPHTSNWDFVICVSVMLALDLKVKFLGKHSIFIWPFRGLLTRLGGIPVDRKSSHGVVQQLVNRCESDKYFILGIAPEGTRSKTNEWKSGFLQIAHQANIPVVPVSLHFDKKQLNFHTADNITSDIDSELQRFKKHFDHACAKKPQAV